MNNLGRIIMIIIWILIAIILLGVLINLMIGQKAAFSMWPFSTSHSTGKRISESTIEYSYETNEITEIQCGLISEDVEVMQWNESYIGVSILHSGYEDRLPEVFLTNKTLIIQQKVKMHNIINIGHYCSVLIKIPETMIDDNIFKSVILETISGSIRGDDIFAGRLLVSTTSGSIKLDGCMTDSADMKTVSGSIKAENIVSSHISSNTTSGSIRVDGKFENINCSTVSGSIGVETKIPLIGSNSLTSVSGSVRLAMPENNGFRLYYSSVSSSVHNEFTRLNAKRSGTDVYKNGETTISLESVSGRITVEKN